MINKSGKGALVDIPTCGWARLSCCLWKGPAKKYFLDNYLTTFFGVCNIGNRSAMRLIFFEMF